MAYVERSGTRRTVHPMSEPWDTWGLHGAPVADEIKGRGTPSRFVRNADGTVEWDPFPLTPDCLDAFRDLISELEAEG
jgi:hypothetical protein